MADYEELDLGYVGEGGGNVDTVDKIEPDDRKNVQLRYFVTKAWLSAADRPLPPGRYVVIDDNGNIGPLIDQKINEAFVQAVKLYSESTQYLYSDFLLRTYIEQGTGQIKAYKLLGTAPDGTEHTLIELAQTAAGGKAEIGSKTIRLNLHTRGGPGIDNHVTVDTDNSGGGAVTLPLAYLADVISQCAQALQSAKNYADEKDAALRVDALIIRPPCNESELPAYNPNAPWNPSHNGYWYQIKDFDVTRPDQNVKGTATWYDDLDEGGPGYYLAYDQYRNADGLTTKLTDEGAIAVNDITQNDIAADTNPFGALNGIPFLTVIKSLVKKINGAFQLTASVNTILGHKANNVQSIAVPEPDTDMPEAVNSGTLPGILQSVWNFIAGLRQDLQNAAGALGGKQDKIIYSTAEQNTGVLWIDNRPVYRRVVPVSVSEMTAGQPVDLSFPGAMSIFAVLGAKLVMYNNTPAPDYTEVLPLTVTSVRSTGLTAIGQFTWDAARNNYYLVLEYTKP
jgi:hypothetical protein